MSNNYRVLKSDSIGAKYTGSKSVNNIRTYPKVKVKHAKNRR